MPSATQYHARYSKLSPTKMIEGLECSFAVEFLGKPNNQAYPGQQVVSAVVEYVISLGGGYWRIVFKRATHTSSYTKPPSAPGARDSVEIKTYHKGGGNVVWSPECQQFVSPYEGTLMGDVRKNRVLPYDVMETPTRGRWHPVTAGKAFGHRPAEGTNWNADGDAQPTVGDFLCDLYEFALEPVGTTYNVAPEGIQSYYEPEPSALASDLLGDWCAASWVNTGAATTGALTRRIFTNPYTGNPDPEYLPTVAQFGDGTVMEYWFDPRTLTFRFATAITTVGDTVRANYWDIATRTGVEVPLVSETAEQALYVTGDFLGYGGTADSLGMMSAEGRAGDPGPTSEEWIVSKVEDEAAIEWRKDFTRTSVMAALLMSKPTATTVALAGLQRTIDGNAAAAPGTFTGATYNLPFRVQIVRSGSMVTIRHRQSSGDAWTEAFSVSLGGVAANTNGIVSLAAWDLAAGIRAARNIGSPTSSWTARHDALRSVLETAAASRACVQRAKQLPVDEIAFFRQIPDIAATALTEVRNVTAGVIMSDIGSGGIPRRNGYYRDGSSIWLYAESAGDRIRITHAADPSSPTAPGPVPRTLNQKNFATADPDNPRISTADPGENRGNWHDYADVWERTTGWLDVVPGQTVIFRRGGIFDPQDPPLLQYDTRNGGGTWTNMPNNSYRADWLRGVVCIAKWFMDSLPPGAKLCLRAFGKRWRRNAGASARIFNELRSFTRCLSGLWVNAGTPGGGSDSSREGSAEMRLCPTGYTCTEFGWKPTGIVWGVPKREFIGEAQTFAAFPYWYVVGSSSAPAYFDSIHRTTAEDPEPYNDCDGDSIGDYEDGIAGESRLVVAPYGGISDMPAGWGAFFAGSGYEGNLILDMSFVTFFRVRGFAFNPPAFFKWLPDGTEILEARMRVRLNGFYQSTWALEQEVDNVNSPDVYELKTYENGSLLYRTWKEAGEPEQFESFDFVPPATTGTIGFMLVGKRLNSASLTFVNGVVGTVPSDTYVALGAGVSASAVEDGKWSIVDVTHAMQALLDARNTALRDFELWPTVGLPIDSGVADMTAYLQSLMPSRTASFVNGAGLDWGYTASLSGKYAGFSSLECGSIHLRLKLPSGEVIPGVVHHGRMPRFM